MAKSKLLQQIRKEIRRRNYSYSTEKTYCSWVVRYVHFHRRLCKTHKFSHSELVSESPNPITAIKRRS